MIAQYDVPASQRDPQLPMVVHLNGDEELLDSFTFDAEQAMEFLGIKRSRLTQISGRELRVGKIRRDRYIRPVYRACDLRDYQEWTRATATHQSSSRAIEQAIESLDDRFNDLLVVFQERLHHNQSDLQSKLEQGFGRVQEAVTRAFHQESRTRPLESEGDVRERSREWGIVRREQRELKDISSALLELQRQHQQTLGHYHQDLRELVNGLLLLRKDVQDMRVEQELALQNEAAIQEAQHKLWETLATDIKLTITEKILEVQEAVAVSAQTRACEQQPPLASSPMARPRRGLSRDPWRRKPYLLKP